MGNYLPLTGGTLTGSLSATTYFGDGSNLSGISFSGQSLSQTLTVGNNSGFNDIIMDNNHVIRSNSGNFLDLRSLDDNKVKLSTNGNQNLTLKYGGTGKTTSTYCLLANDGENFTDAYLYLEEENYAQLARYRTGDSTYYGFNLYGDNTYQQYSTGVSIKDNQTNSFTSANKNNPAIIIGSKNSTITSGVTNSVVIGGSGITVTQSDSVYLSKPIIISASTPSSTADSSGVQGEVRYDSDWLYIKTAAGWKRTALSSF